MRKIFCYVFVLVLGTISSAVAQNSCTENIYKANKLYEIGKFKEAIALIEPCATSSHIKSEQWQAYRLLALAYLGDAQQFKAKKAVEKMMEINPTYKWSSTKDPAQLRNMISSIKLIPKFSLGLAATIGPNFSLPRVTATYNATDYKKVYSSKGGWTFGALSGYAMNEIISLHVGLIASSQKYDIDYQVDGDNFNVLERYTYLDFPLFARFKLPLTKNLFVHCEAGVFTGKLLNSFSDFTINTNESKITRELDNLSAISRRNSWNYGALFGTGLLYNYRKVDFTIDMRYYAAMISSVNDAEKRFSNDNLFYDYYYLDDDVRLNNLSITASVNFHLNYKALKEK